jgi:hypothetical protein
MVYFQTKKKSPILESLAMEDVGTCILFPFGLFSCHLVYFVGMWYILWFFGIFYGYLVCGYPFWYVFPRKIWQPRI